MSCGTNDPMPHTQAPISPLSAAEIATLVQGIAYASSSVADANAGMTAVSATLRELRSWCGSAEVGLAMVMYGDRFVRANASSFAELGPDWYQPD